MERPRGRKWLSSAEVGLLDFIAGKKRRPKKAKQVEKTADAAVKAAEQSGPSAVKRKAQQADAAA
jgi:hypothetical protein